MPTRAPNQYLLRFPEPHAHRVEVEARYPLEGSPDALELFLAVWTPGSYLVREYARNIESLRARGGSGRELPIRKTRKNRWEVRVEGESELVLDYRLYARELSVRTNWVEADFALINGAPTFITRLEKGDRPHEVRVEMPETWELAVAELAFEPRPDAGEEDFVLASASGGGERVLRAESFDRLVDTPLLFGNPVVHSFEAGGRPHFLVNEGEGGVWDGPGSARDVEAIVRTQIEFWGNVPYERYVFMNLILESGGGLEHRGSTVLMTSRWKSRSREKYLEWLGLVSHEFFHTWNVKRLRPLELGPFDFENEVTTRSLWVAEGITNYYTALLVLRAGLSTEDDYLAALSKFIERLESSPGKSVQTLEESSFDAWIKLYRPDENSANSTISYYVKGAVVAFLLDAKIRRSSAGKTSLDDVLREASARWSGERGFRGEEFEALVEEISGLQLSEDFDRWLRSTEGLDYSEALATFGLAFDRDLEESVRARSAAGAEGSAASAGGSAASAKKRDGSEAGPRAWLGLTIRPRGGRLIVSRVERGSPAEDGGLNVDDELLALDGYRVVSSDWKERLGYYSPGDLLSALVARRERILSLDVIASAKPERRYALKRDPAATPEQERQRAAWLGIPSEAARAAQT